MLSSCRAGHRKAARRATDDCGFCCAWMTFHYIFVTRRRLRLRRASPGRRQPRLEACRVRLPPNHGDPRQIQVPPPPPPPPASPRSASGGCSAVAAPQLAALAVMLQTETDFGVAYRFSAVMGNPELLLDRPVAAPRAVGRAVADAGRGADPAVAAQARYRADDRELRRPDGDRPRYRSVPVYDLPQSALVGDLGGPRHHAR